MLIEEKDEIKTIIKDKLKDVDLTSENILELRLILNKILNKKTLVIN